MANNSRTKSELLFEELCAQHGIVMSRLPVCEKRKQPDYKLTFGEQNVVVEVKQIEPNKDDKTFTAALKRDGEASQCRNPDDVAERVRNHIKGGMRQIKSYLQHNPGMPAILIIFDNAKNEYTDAYTIQTAMHGFEKVVFKLPNRGQPITVVERGFGPHNNKEIRQDKNQDLSAVATLHEFWDLNTHERGLALCFYHNNLAKHPFATKWWKGKNIVHLIIENKTPGEFQNWVRIDNGEHVSKEE